MPGFTESGVCRAPAVEVWKLLHDPARYTEWWTGTERVQVDGDGLARYVRDAPGFAYPTAIATTGAGDRVTISCVLTDIVYEWTLEPDPAGCAVRLRVEIPADLAAKLDGQLRDMRDAFARLVAMAEREGSEA